MARGELGSLAASNDSDIKSLQRRASMAFPLPPPTATTRKKIPDGLMVNEAQQEKLGVVFVRVQEALHHAQIYGWALLPIGYDGFAVVCAMEAFDDYGVALPEPQRFSPEPVRPQTWGLWYYVQALLAAPPGRYRVIVLAVTSEPDLPPTRRRPLANSIGISKPVQPIFRRALKNNSRIEARDARLLSMNSGSGE